ncbi:LysR family transcriptional regulator [Acinetobacter sp. YH1901134]|uniref:LysR family transcriptional regulator n=1 Tax=Acinetobacter sp. YH1901134 TaxID=2601199 RepID=UPI0015D11BC1|nr:LysR family transcriptional regulator [Acinetobacter sp. YH1901134]
MSITFSRFSEYFMAVARTGSLRKAAEQLFISVSAVHRQIVLAEEELGVALFERLHQGLKLTLAGELLYADLLKWQKEYQLTRTRFDEIQGLNRGNIEMGFIAALNDSFVVDCIQKMAETYPWINLNISMNSSDDISRKIVDAELDFGIILNPKSHSQLEILSFIEIPLGFVMSPHHTLGGMDKIYLSDTLNERHILPSEPLIISEYVQTLYKHHKFSPIQKIECNDIRMILSLVQQQLGISVMSYMDALPLLENKKIIFKPIREKGLHSLTIALCVASKRQTSRISQIMINLLVEKMEEIKINLKSLNP